MIVETWMTREVTSIDGAATVREAAAIMGAHHLRRLPVVRDGAVVGVVTRSDLLRGAAIDPFSAAATCDPTPQRLVRAVMTSPVVTTTPTTALEDAAQLMLERKIGALPVVRETGTLIGILTESDTLRALIGALRTDGACPRLVFDGGDVDALLAVLVARARPLGLSIVGLATTIGSGGRECIVTVRGRDGARLADAAWAAGHRVRSVVERLG
jgi:CBS domain-containing protein